MLFIRRSATIAALTVLACTISLLGGFSASPRGAATAAGTSSTSTNAVSPAAMSPRAVSPGASHTTVGKPRVNAPMRSGSVFSYPNRGKRKQVAIRKRILNTIKSTWGGRRYSSGTALPSNGRIRIATWTFQDWAIARALYKAHKRGVSVQILAAKGPNKRHRPWKWLRKRLPHSLYRAGHPETISRWSFARHCRGSCRGRGGTAHSKYLLFSNVGAYHVPNITVQTSMNLTQKGYKGQWNHATTTWRRGVHRAFGRIFAESRRDRPVSKTYRRFVDGKVQSIFFPRPGTTARYDPVMRALRKVQCRGTTMGGDRRHRTQIRIIQYAIYNSRGAWIAKRLKRLWNAGCNIKIIYAVTSRPVLSILRSRGGRGPVPMRQSVVRNPYGEIVKYNHNKWMTITGHWGASTRRYVVFPGSSNWGNLSFSSDEQMQQIISFGHTRQHLAAFAKTWKQRSSRKPSSGRVYSFARMLPGASDPAFEQIPEEPVFGEGIYKYLPED
jgi:hypothetical protein